MAGTIRPRDANELRQAVEWALNEGTTLDVRGQGSKIALGKPMDCGQVLDLSGISGIVDYAPEELVVTLRAGTPMREVEALLAQRNQMLAFEPPDLGPLLGQAPGQGTLVGAVMGNLAGSRRLSAGAARDHLLGFSGVNGRGEAFKSGGRVMKNVTGYDLSKLLAGSWGTLAVLDQVSVKVLPVPDQTRTLLLLGLDDAAAVRAMCAALGSPHEVSGAVHLPGRTALRIEGVAPSVEARLAALRELLADAGAAPFGAKCATWRRSRRPRTPWSGRFPVRRPKAPPSWHASGHSDLQLKPFTTGRAVSCGWRCRRASMPTTSWCVGPLAPRAAMRPSFVHLRRCAPPCLSSSRSPRPSPRWRRA